MIYYCNECETFHDNNKYLFGNYKYSYYLIKQCNVCKYYSNLTSRPPIYKTSRWYDILCCWC